MAVIDSCTVFSDEDPKIVLRQRAEVLIGKRPSDSAARSIHELQVHQVELEMQNEELRQSQVDLAAAQDLYRDLYEHAPVGYLTLSSKGVITRANLSAATLLGAERSTLGGSNLQGMLSPDQADKLHLHLLDAHQSREPRLCELALHGEAGTVHLRLDTLAVSADATPTQFRVVLADITERVHAETMLAELNARLEQQVLERTSALQDSERALDLESAAKDAAQQQLLIAQKMEAVGRLAGGVAHDLNNALQVIYTAAGLLRRGCSARQMAFLTQVEQAAGMAGSLTNQLLRFTKQRSFHIETLNLVSVISAVETLLLHALDERVKLSVTFDVEDAWVEADRSQLEQALLSLALNAREAMPDGGELSLRCTCVEIRPEDLERLPKATLGGYAKVAVVDSGTGMDEKTQLHAFDPFFTTKPMGQGSGLGLSSVYGTVDGCGGFITLESALGKGTSFEVYLPCAKKPVERSQAPSTVRKPCSTQEVTILLVEDDEKILKIVRRILTGHGYNVSTASDAAQALRIVDEGHRTFDLLLTDIRMPGMSGKALAEQIRSRSLDTRIIYMSGYIGEEDLNDGSAFLAKPFTNAELLATVAATLDE